MFLQSEIQFSRPEGLTPIIAQNLDSVLLCLAFMKEDLVL